MKTKWFITAAGTICLISIFAGCLRKKESSLTTASMMRVKVSIDTVARRDMKKTILYTGVLEAYKKADLGPLTQGTRVRKFNVDIGDRVRKGQVLAVMDDANLFTTRINFEVQKANYERNKRLYEKNALSKAQFDNVESAYLSAKRLLKQVEENTMIRAPFSGIVTARSVEEGELFFPQSQAMGAGSGGLIQVTRLDPLKIDLEVDENSVALLKKGMSVELRVNALPDTVLTGEVEWVNPSAKELSHTFAVRIVVTNKKHLLKAGYFTEIRIITETKEDVLTVPVNALVDTKVFTIHQDSIACARKVTVGWQNAEYAEIISGLAEGDMVIVKGNKALPDSTVVIVE